MASRLPARLKVADGRKFGLTLGAAFLLLTVLLWWRGHNALMVVTLVLGILFGIAALLVPGRLGGVQRTWLRFGHLVSRVTTPLVMALLYILVFTPAGLIRRLFGHNSIVHEARGGTYFLRRASSTSRSMEHQY